MEVENSVHQADRLQRHLCSLYLVKRQEILNYGLNTFLEAEWLRLQVPSVLRIFWLSRLSVILVQRRVWPVSLDILKGDIQPSHWSSS